MQDRTITAALHALRLRLIREDGDGLHHVEALLVLRGCNLAPVPRPVAPNAFRKGELRRLIMAALSDGPQPLTGIATYIVGRKPDVPYERAYFRASCVLGRMRRAGLVEHERPVWLLTAASPYKDGHSANSGSTKEQAGNDFAVC